MKLELSTWTHHLNHLIYSYFYYSKVENRKLNIFFNNEVKHNGAILHVDNFQVFFDYSDDTKFLDMPENFHFYFKRSLLKTNTISNVFPLNFNVPLSYKSFQLICHLKKDFLVHKKNRTEVIRALDFFSLLTNSSHRILDARRFPNKISDNGGKIIFYTRLWNPDNNPDAQEKERRKIQNDFRINACRIIKKHFKNASVGLFPDDLSKRIAPDILLDTHVCKKKNYFNSLYSYDIGIADDGLKDSPGWKIGEYLLYGKAVITTPINVEIENFKEGINYEKITTRSSYLELPDKIDILLKDKKYLEVGHNNLDWSHIYLHPIEYFARILKVIEQHSNLDVK